MNDTTIQGLTSAETAIAFFIVLGMAVFILWVYRHNTVFNQSDKEDPGHRSNRDKQAKQKAPDFIFTDVADQGITCKYMGVEVMYTTVANDMVCFFWTVGRTEALPSVLNPKNHTMGLERMMRRAIKERFEPNKGILSAQKGKATKTKDGDFQVIDYANKTSELEKFKAKKDKNIELTF